MATAVSSVTPPAELHRQEPTPAPAPAPAPISGSDEQLPTAAQILLQNFTLPEFPEKASSLRALTLTSDIKPTEYADLLNPTASVAAAADSNSTSSSLPKGIEALTLELFSLGYPPFFLTKLSKGLPKLKTLTLYSQLVDGVSDGSRRDAGEFFSNVLVGKKENSGGLRELHLLDTFSRKGFISGLGAILEDLNATAEGVLRFLEVSYTYRGHSDSNFLDRIPGDELPTMLVPSLIAASFSLAAPVSRNTNDTTPAEFPDDPADVDENGNPIPGRKPEGIIPLANSNPGVAILMRKLTGEKTEETKAITKDDKKSDDDDDDDKDEPAYRPGSGPGPRNLKMLDTTVYSLDTTQLASIVRSQQGLAVLSASVLVSGTEPATSKASLLDALRGGKDGSSGKELEIVEIVGVPEGGFEQEPRSSESTTNKEELLHNVFPTASDMADLSAHLPRLESFKMTILRARSFGAVEWTRSADGKWTGGVTKSSQ